MKVMGLHLKHYTTTELYIYIESILSQKSLKGLILKRIRNF